MKWNGTFVVMLSLLLALGMTVVSCGDKGSGDSTSPGGTDPGGTNPGGTDPGSTDPGGTDPGGTDPGGTDPGNVITANSSATAAEVVAALAAYISSASGGGSAANPVVVKLNVSDPSQLNYNGSGGLATLFAAINGAYYLNSGVYKYVSFDLSGSTIANTYDMLSPYSTYCNPKYLASITLPNTLTNISNIFQNCSSLTSITIPAGVTSSWNYTFKNCTSLTSVIMRPSTPPTLGTNMFDNTPAGLKIKVANGLLAAYTTNNTVDGWTADIKAKVQAE